MSIKFLRILLLLLLTFHFCSGQKMFTHHWTKKDGLPHNFLYHLKEANGKLWIGTDDGMSTFNGKEFKTYSTQNGLNSEFVIGFNQNNTDSVYLFTWRGGVHVFNEELDTIQTYPFMQKSGAKKLHQGIKIGNELYGWQWSSAFYMNLKEQKSHKLNFYSHRQNGKEELFLRKDKPIPFYNSKNSRTISLGLTRFQNKILVYGFDTQGIRIIDGTTLKGNFFEEALGNIIISATNISKNGGLLVGSKGQILLLSPEGDIEKTIKINDHLFPTKLYQLNNGNIVAAVNENNHKQRNILINSKTGKITYLEKALNTKSFSSSVLVDKQDRIWISTQGDGLYLIEDTDFKYLGIDEIDVTHVLSINQIDSVNLAFSTTNRLYQYNLKTDSLSILREYPVKDIITKDDNIFFTTYGHSYSIKNDSIPVNWSIFAGNNQFGDWYIEEDSLKVVQQNPMSQKFDMVKVFQNFPKGNIKQSKISSAAITDTTIWVATKGALLSYALSENFKLDLKDSWIQNFKNGERINYVYIDKSGVLLWVGTSEGLYFLQIKDQLEKNKLQKVLALEGVNCTTLYQDHLNQLWVGTDEGLSVLKNGTLKRQYNTSSGLINDQVTRIFESSDHQLWISTLQGIMSMPNHKEATTIPPPHVSWKKSIYNSHSKFSILELPIKISALSEMESIKLQYKISKASDWINFQYTDVLKITNKEPGEYNIYVRGKTIGSDWSTPAIASLNIEGYFWEHTLFKGGIFFLIIISLIYSSNYKIKKEKIKTNELKEIIRERAEAQKKLARVRTEIAQDFHDEMGNKLASITVLADLASLKLKGKDIETEKILYRIETQSKLLYSGTRDFIWSIDAKNDELSVIYDYIKDFGEDFFDELEIRYHSKKEIPKNENLVLPHSWSLQIVFIFKEAMTNIAKYAKATHVYLSIIEEKQNIKIEIKDNGIGMSNTDSKHGNGLKNMHSRIKKLANATLSIESKENEGTSISVTFDSNFNNNL
ncbi:hypothetical protein EO216_11230 [Flammeovirga kamogawensis]|nr:hypothetical protein EO216_11230 [Flammeovirga kamogawensis]